MSAVEDFKSKFDSEGYFLDQNGTLNVMFATKGGLRSPGRLHFSAGLCVRAEMDRGREWANPDDSPIHGIRFLSVARFDAADFAELGAARRAELLAAVQSFKAVADQVPCDKPPTNEQYENGRVAFAKMPEILEPYLAMPDEDRQIEAALRTVGFPSWVVNWDYELATDSDGGAVIWVNVFADEQVLPSLRLGRASSDLSSRVREALSNRQISRWPYIRMRTALEHKVG